MEHKSVSLELKDFSPGSRTGVLAHAVYNNIDRTQDISRKGMFTKSWQEIKNIDFLFNHENGKTPGNVKRVFEDEQKAYTEVKFGNWTLGNDVMEMIDAGVIKGVSFGYKTEKKADVIIKGKKIRELKEVWHYETSILTVMPANPLTSVISLTKSAEMDLMAEMKAHIDAMEKFCRETKASDETIKKVLNDLAEAKAIMDKFDTGDTPISVANGGEQLPSEEKADTSDDVLLKLKLLTLSM